MTPTDHRSDTELLIAYERDRDDAAFALLAARHVDMIFAVSFRRSGNRQLAEEATQNVLIALSSKARQFTAQDSNLTAWLHTCTKFEIAKLQRREARITLREKAYASELMKTSPPDEEDAFRRLLPLLDQAIDQLRAPYREVIIRRYLQGQDFRNIGKALGITEDAAQKRTSRAFDALNQFFKRKAGVSVSATALTAGISQHCAEAAPAACLSIMGQTAATGAASGITTSTIISIMSTHKIAAIAVGVALLSSATFVVTRDKSQTEIVSSPPQPSVVMDATARTKNAERPVVTNAARPAGDAPDYSPNKELARLQGMSPHPSKQEFVRRLSVKHDLLLKDLTDDLGLSTAQVTSVKQALDTRLKSFRDALESDPQRGDSEQESLRNEQEMVVSAGKIVQGIGLRENLKGILSAEQLAAFDEREAEAWQSQVESHAYTEFSKIAPALDLTEEQKDKVFGLLQASSEETLRADGAERAFAAIQMGKVAAQMDMPDAAEMKFFMEIMQVADKDTPEIKERLIQLLKDRIDQRVERLAPILDERQKQLYRDHLTRQSPLSDLPTKLPESK